MPVTSMKYLTTDQISFILTLYSIWSWKFHHSCKEENCMLMHIIDILPCNRMWAGGVLSGFNGVAVLILVKYNQPQIFHCRHTLDHFAQLFLLYHKHILCFELGMSNGVNKVHSMGLHQVLVLNCSQFLTMYGYIWGSIIESVHVFFYWNDGVFVSLFWSFYAFVIPSFFSCVLPNPAESREGKCPVVSDELGGCGHSRTSSYASQQSKVSGRANPLKK